MNAKGVLEVSFLRLSNVAVSLLLTIICARFLDPALYTEIFYLMSLIFILAPLISLGVPETIIKYSGFVRLPRSVVSCYFLVIVVSSLLTSLLFFEDSHFSVAVGVFAFVVSLSVSEFNRAQGKYGVAVLYNSLLFVVCVFVGVFLLTELGVDWKWIFIVYLFISITGLSSFKYSSRTVSLASFLRTSGALMLVSVSGALLDNFEMIYLEKTLYVHAEEVLPVLRLIRGYGFPAIVMAFYLAPMVSKVVYDSHRIGDIFRFYYKLGILFSIAYFFIYFFGEYALTVLFGSASEAAVAWNKSVILMQLMKMIVLPMFLYMMYVAPVKLALIMIAVVALKYVAYESFPDALVGIYLIAGLALYLAVTILFLRERKNAA